MDDTVSEEEEQRLAYAKVLRCVSACEQSSIRMRKKLVNAGFSERAIAYALDKAQRVGAIDDIRYCECLIRSTLLSGKGLEFAKREVHQLGVELEDLEAYQDCLKEGGEAQLETAVDYLRTHPPRAKDAYGASIRKLISRGYDLSLAKEAAKTWLDEMHRPE